MRWRPLVPIVPMLPMVLAATLLGAGALFLPRAQKSLSARNTVPPPVLDAKIHVPLFVPPAVSA